MLNHTNIKHPVYLYVKQVKSLNINPACVMLVEGSADSEQENVIGDDGGKVSEGS